VKDAAEMLMRFMASIAVRAQKVEMGVCRRGSGNAPRQSVSAKKKTAPGLLPGRRWFLISESLGIQPRR